MSKLWLAALIVPAILLLGCGGSDEEDVESVLRVYIAHYVDSEPAEMYALLDSASQDRCSEEGFIAFISGARQALGEREFVVEEVRGILIDGDGASAIVASTVEGEPADPTENTLVKEDGGWKLELPSGGC